MLVIYFIKNKSVSIANVSKQNTKKIGILNPMYSAKTTLIQINEINTF